MSLYSQSAPDEAAALTEELPHELTPNCGLYKEQSSLHRPQVIAEGVECADCGCLIATADELLECWTTTTRMVATGISVLTGELEAMREDVLAASSELMVSIDKAPPGSDVRRLMIANRLMRYDVSKFRGACAGFAGDLRGLRQAIQEDADHGLPAETAVKRVLVILDRIASNYERFVVAALAGDGAA